MKLRAREEQRKKEEEEEEKREMEAVKKEAEKQKMQKMIEDLKKEADLKQTMHYVEEATLAHYSDVESMWDEVDYAYIEHYMGSAQRKLICTRDRERKLQEAILHEHNLIQAFEFKRQELLMKLQQAHQQFLESLEEESREITLHAQISRAFVFSYFRCIPRAVQGLISEQVTL